MHPKITNFIEYKLNYCHIKKEKKMHTIDSCIKDLDNLNIFDKDKKLNILSFFSAIKDYENIFYKTNACYINNENIIIRQLKNKIAHKKLITRDKTEIDLWDINPYRCKKYIIFCEGISSEKSSVLQQYAYLKLAESGWGVAAFDYRGRGKSSGIFSQKGAVADVKTIYEYLIVCGITASDIGVIGHSMGSGVAADFCSQYQTAFTVLINPFSKASDMAKRIAQKAKLPLFANSFIQKLPSFLIPLQNRFDNERALKKIKSPVLIIHTKDDSVIPVEFARRLYKENLRKNVNYLELNNNDHEINEEKIDACIKFIANHS